MHTDVDEPCSRAQRRDWVVPSCLRQALDQALRGSQSRAALAILDREEANYRTAVQWAVADRQFPAADNEALPPQKTGEAAG